MCGIAGYWSVAQKLSADEGLELVRAMSEVLSHRGPNADRHWGDAAQGIFLGHRRLSILDLSEAGSQPMISHCGRYVMVFNGEIYNFKKLQAKFFSDITFRGHSDSEILLESLARLGVQKTLEIVKGMFAFALWDQQDKTLTLARDHIGKKPLYAGWVGDKLVFASELKAFQKLSSGRLEIDREALQHYKYFGFIPAPYSIYKGIKKVLPGHVVTLREEDVKDKNSDLILAKMKRYWEVKKSNDVQNDGDFKSLICSAVSDRMIADVPLGAFLSGGLDSSLVTALMQEQSSKPVKTYSIGFTDQDFDESKHAEKIAAHLGTDHTTYQVTEVEAQAIVPDLPRIYDEPFADYSQIPTAVLCQQVRKDTTVALSGDGGDEVFCGYKRYFLLKKLLDATRYMPRKIIAALLKMPRQKIYNALGLSGRRMHSIAGFLEEEGLDSAVLRSLSIDPDVSRPDLDLRLTDDLTDLERMMMIDTQLYLPDDILVKVDRASMAASLEVRSPLLDKDVIEYAWSLPIKQKYRKKPIYDLLCTYVPEDLINRPKQGFTPPIAHWLRGDLRDWAEDLLWEDTGLYDLKNTRKLWDEFITGYADHHNALWGILMAQAWYKFNIERDQ